MGGFQVNYPTLYTVVASDPASAAEGQFIFNSTTDQIKVYYGGSWHTVGGGGGSAAIPQYDTDPVSPSAQDAWVLRTAGAPGSPAGEVVGLLLSLTSSGTSAGADTYQLSYYTNEGTTIRIGMS